MKVTISVLLAGLLSLSLVPSVLAKDGDKDKDKDKDKDHGSCSSFTTITTITTTVTPSAPTSTSSSTAAPSQTNLPFTFIAAHSTSPIHLRTVDAKGEKFYIGNGGPATYCPVPPLTQSECPPGNVTAIIVSGGTASMVRSPPSARLRSTHTTIRAPFPCHRTCSLTFPSKSDEVPGGQMVYVAPDGSLSYTVAHSASIPPGSATTTFTHTPSNPSTGQLGTFGFTGLGATGFVACPLAGGSAYQVFADVSGKDWSQCIGFDALTSDYTAAPVAAWEYT